MSIFHAIGHRGRAWFQRAEYDRALNEEIEFHMALEQEHHGATAGADDTRAAARRRFGNETYLKEETRRMAKLHLVDAVLSDLRYLFRTLRRSPGFAGVTVLTLGLGIGATTAVVSVADHVLVRALPFHEPDRLMMMLERDDHGAFRAPSAPTALDWQRDPDAAQAFEGISFVRGDGVSLLVGAESEVVGSAFVGPEFFPLVGARPTVGRVLVADDHRVGGPRVAVMSHRLWQRRFGGDPSIVGRTITVDSAPTTVIGILPVGTVYPPFADLWTPVSQYRHPEILLRRGVHADSRTVARLRVGVDSARAMSLMRTIGARLAAEHPVDQSRWMPAIRPIRDEIIGNVKPMVLTFAGAAVAVLLLVCANVASLLLARSVARSREIAVRTALGASRGRVVRQLLTESLTLAAFGGALGTACAVIGVELSRKALAGRVPRIDELGLDGRVLIVAMGATILTALMCGLWPALRATRGDQSGHAELLRANAMGSVGVRSEVRVRRGLVTVQFALALMLLIGAGLLLQSFRRAAAVDVGFDPAGVATFRVRLPDGAYSKPDEAAALYARLVGATRGVPGVVDAGFINHAPFGLASIYTTLSIDGRSNLDSSDQILYRTVSDSYLATMRMSIAAGRWFDGGDMRSPGGRFVINQAMARQYWPGIDPIGRHITVRRASQARADIGQPLAGTIVGVVRDVYQTRQDVAPDPEIYVPYTLETWPWGMLVVRSRDAAGTIPSLARAVRSVDPRLVAAGPAGEREFGLMEDAVANSLQPRRASTALIGAFAACALLLASMGMYGVVAYTISRRTREIGVRRALGATNGRIVGLVMRESLQVVTAGIVVGGVAAVIGARVIRALLFNTGVVDAPTYLATIALLAAAALAATYLPARRAIRLEPTIAIRGD